MNKKKKLLIYTNYYSPDVASIGQILQELAEGMTEQFDITVICTVPSYSGQVAEKYRDKRYYSETLHGVRLIRIRVPGFDKRNKISRIRHILSFFFGALVATKNAGKQDYVLCSSDPPIIGGLLGVWGKWHKHAKLVYNIQDFNPEAIMAVGYSRNKLLLKLLLQLDKFTCRHSNLIITVGRDLVETVQQRFHHKNVPTTVMINNWADEKKLHPLLQNDLNVEQFKRANNLEDKFIIMYSGNIGLYYDLENLIKVIRHFPAGTQASDGRQVEFVFIGQGAMLSTLKDYVKVNNMANVSFLPYQDKSQLNFSLNSADIHWCVSAKGIKGVSCPSKFYGIAAAGKPVLGVLDRDSEIGLLIRETKGGFLAQPEDYVTIKKNINACLQHAEALAKMGFRNRLYVEKHLTKAHSIQKYIESIEKA